MLHNDEDANNKTGENVNLQTPAPPPQVMPSSLLPNREVAQAQAPVANPTVSSPAGQVPQYPAPPIQAKYTSSPAPVPAPTFKQQPPTPMTQTTLASLALLGNLPPLSPTPAAEAVKNFLETAKTALAAPIQGYTLTLMPVQRTDTSVNLFASSIVVIVQHTNQPNAGLGYHTLILADTAGPLQAEFETINGIQVEVIRVVGEAYDKDYRAVIAQQLAKQFPQVNPTTMFDSEGQVVPYNYNYKDVNIVQTTLASAALAAATLLNQASANYKDFSLQPGVEQAQSIAKLQFGQPQSIDTVGLPQRTDVTILYSELTGQQRQPGGAIQSLNSGQRSTPLFRLGGFMDLVWYPAQEVLQNNPYAAAYGSTVQNQVMPHLYQPRFVITNVDARTLKTLPGQLLGLVTVLTLRDNNNWMGAFRRPTGTDKNIHDIGAIGIEANMEKNASGYGSPFDTRSANFTDRDLADLLRAFVRPDLAISLDVDECGPTTWLNSVFLAAAKNNAEANQYIIDAADLLTNGRFKPIFGTSGRVVINDQSRIHLGHYTDSTGATRDLRDIDHLCVLNTLGERDEKLARDWSDTFAKIGYPIQLRLQVRRRIMDLISPNVVITGYAQRVTFTTVFLDALERAVAATGLTIRSETPYQDAGVGARASADWLQAGALSGNANSVFTRGFTPQGGGGYGTTGGFGRWN